MLYGYWHFHWDRSEVLQRFVHSYYYFLPGRLRVLLHFVYRYYYFPWKSSEVESSFRTHPLQSQRALNFKDSHLVPLAGHSLVKYLRRLFSSPRETLSASLLLPLLPLFLLLFSARSLYLSHSLGQRPNLQPRWPIDSKRPLQRTAELLKRAPRAATTLCTSRELERTENAARTAAEQAASL